MGSLFRIMGDANLMEQLPALKHFRTTRHAVSGRCEIYIDGGIRRGVDILKALALGARAVLIGRPAPGIGS